MQNYSFNPKTAVPIKEVFSSGDTLSIVGNNGNIIAVLSAMEVDFTTHSAVNGSPLMDPVTRIIAFQTKGDQAAKLELWRVN